MFSPKGGKKGCRLLFPYISEVGWCEWHRSHICYKCWVIDFCSSRSYLESCTIQFENFPMWEILSMLITLLIWEILIILITLLLGVQCSLYSRSPQFQLGEVALQFQVSVVQQRYHKMLWKHLYHNERGKESRKATGKMADSELFLRQSGN